MKTIMAKQLMVVFTVAVLCVSLTKSADAAWLYKGTTPTGVPMYFDTNTGLTWTRTLGRVKSSQNGATARQHLNQIGFRLPSFYELQTMYNNDGGGPVLGIHNGLFDYYETNDVRILGNAFGNGFQTPQQRKGVGHNWYIGVRP